MRDFLDILHSRKSVRSFKPDPVPREVVENILDAAVYAPTNCNQQLWNFVIVENSETKERLIKEAASNTLIRRAPMLIVVSYDGWNYKEAIQGGALSVGHILTAATYYGVGSLPMNSYGADSKVKEILGIPDNQTICCFVLLGYPDDKAEVAKPVPRREAKEVTHWGGFRSKELPSYSYNPNDWTRETLVAHQKFYCRKTFLGKEMDIMSDYERLLVKKELDGLSGPVTDIMSYDGAYLREFPEVVNLTTVDLCPETSEYTIAAAGLSVRKVEKKVLDPAAPLPPVPSTLIFKLERLPKALRQEIFESVSGELVIIARKRNILLSFFFFVIKFLFGNDVRKTGIYTFFGPYKPINLDETIQLLRQSGFQHLEWHGYFPIPTFYEQVLQMVLQYRASEGSSYLHRQKRTNILTKLLGAVMHLQGFVRTGLLGSVVVIKCRK
ncbi:MAG TPA: nitroreductase family protein [Candidatus Paceibacterota bacterium]